MKRLATILILTLALFGGAFVSDAQAGDPLTAQFNPNPLFDVSEFLPGDVARGTITATNNTAGGHDVYIRFIKNSETKHIADAVTVSVSRAGGAEIRSEALSKWFSDGVVFLENLDPGETRSFDVEALFHLNAGNEYQEGDVDFDVCVGISGGDYTCMDETTDPGGGGTSCPDGECGPDDDPDNDNTPNEEDEDDDGDDIPDTDDNEPFIPNTPPNQTGTNTGVGGFGDASLANAGGGGAVLSDLGLDFSNEDTSEGSVQGESDTNLAAAAFLGIPGELGEMLHCISIFLLVLFMVGFLTYGFDRVRGARYLSIKEDRVGRIVFMDIVLFLALLLAIFIPLPCTIIPLYVSTAALSLLFFVADRYFANT